MLIKHKIHILSKNQAAQGILTYYKMFSLDAHDNPVRLESQGWAVQTLEVKKLLLRKFSAHFKARS